MLNNQILPAGYMSAEMLSSSASRGPARVEVLEGEEIKALPLTPQLSKEDLKAGCLTDLGVCLMWASLSGLI